MTHTTYAVLTPAGWQIATKVPVLSYFKKESGFTMEQMGATEKDEVWSQRYTSAWLCKVGEELAYIELSPVQRQVIANGKMHQIHPDVSDLIQGYDEAMASKRANARAIDVALHGEENAARQASLCDLIGPATELRQKHMEACDRLFDILLGDDGEAYFQAERWLKNNRPDLYDRLGK